MSYLLLGMCGRKKSGKDTVGSLLVTQYGFVRIAWADRLKQLAHMVFGLDAAALFGDDKEKPVPGAAFAAYWDRAHERIDWHRAAIIETFLGHGKEHVRMLKHVCEAYMRVRGAALTPREALQFMGTEWGRAVFQDVWVDWGINVADLIGNQGYGYDPMLGLLPPDGPLRTRTSIVITDVRFANEVHAVQRVGGHVWWIDAEKRLPQPDQVQFDHSSEPRAEVFRPLVDKVVDNNGSLEALERNVAVAIEPDLLSLE